MVEPTEEQPPEEEKIAGDSGDSSEEAISPTNDMGLIDPAELEALVQDFEAQSEEPAPETPEETAETAEDATETPEDTHESLEDPDAALLASLEPPTIEELIPKELLESGENFDQESVNVLLSELSEGVQTADPPETGAAASLDTPLGDVSEEDVLDAQDPESPLIPSQNEAADASPPDEEPEEDIVNTERALSQSVIDDIVAAASGASPAEPEIAPENLAAAATASEAPVSRSAPPDVAPAPHQSIEDAIAQATAAADLGALSDEMDDAPPEVFDITPPDLPETPAAPSFLHRHLVRVTASLLAGLLTTLATYTVLSYNREHQPDLETLTRGAVHELSAAMDRARQMMQIGDYAGAAQTLERPLRQHRAADNLRADAAYLLLEAQYRGFLPLFDGAAPLYEQLQGDIDTLVGMEPAHPRAPEALFWKARLYEMNDLPYAAQDLYRQLLRVYPDAPQMDEILAHAASVSLSVRDAREAAAYCQRLLQRYPSSQYAQRARLLLGDAYHMAGMEDDARTLYIRVAQAEPNTRVGAEAYLRLGRMAFNQRLYADAIHQFETRLRTTTTIDGNDEVYLMLAQAYRQSKRLEDARNTLNDLLNFFPETDITPLAFIELSQVMDELGDRQKALNLAQQAAARFPIHPGVLTHQGEMLGLSGNPFGAAAALVAAEDAGARDPDLLLIAARHYRTAGMPEKAIETYERLRQRYSGSPQAFTAGIEQADQYYALGRASLAVDQLENLAKAFEGSPHLLPALQTLSKIYRDFGLDDRVAGLARQMVSLTTDPETLADAARALVETGHIEEARRIFEELDFSRVQNATAYGLLTAFGYALLQVDPQRGLDTMEEAALSYPEQRIPEGDRRLLETYLVMDRPAAARRLVMELAARARENPADAPHLIEAAILWGDYLYGKGDYRAAADAFSLAIEAAERAIPGETTPQNDPRWAKYQRANALLALSDFNGSIPLFQEVAASDAPWAVEAGIKADYARLEQRRRGIVEFSTPGREG